MAAPRLPFLWPMLFRSAERAAFETRPVLRRQTLQITSRRRHQSTQQRYGTANEPPPRLSPESKSAVSEKTTAPTKKRSRSQKNTEENTTTASEQTAAKATVTGQQTDAATALEATGSDASGEADLSSARSPVPPLSTALESSTQNEKPGESLLDSVPDPLQSQTRQSETPAPVSSGGDEQPTTHAPHMDTPPYVHHFDTFGLVKRLEESGWKNDQAVTVMKSMRLLLADNMNLARDALVSKSQVENEGYLFKAACSELRIEVLTRRRGEQEKMRTERAQLQHEVDIINQRFSQDSATLKDELKGMFDDRKMSVRNEQREMERKIAELNYKITVSLQADSRSDIEGLRWIMTRRVIITLLVIVIMVLGSLKLYSNAMHEREMEQKRRAAMRSVGTQADDGVGSDAGMNSQTIEGHMVVNGGENPAYVSLG